jgi:hypothetical protein
MSGSSSGIGGTSRPLGADSLCLSSDEIFLDETRHMIGHPHASMDIYVNEVDISLWKIVMQGPANSPYEHGTFVLFVLFVQLSTESAHCPFHHSYSPP